MDHLSHHPGHARTGLAVGVGLLLAALLVWSAWWGGEETARP